MERNMTHKYKSDSNTVNFNYYVTREDLLVFLLLLYLIICECHTLISKIFTGYPCPRLILCNKTNFNVTRLKENDMELHDSRMWHHDPIKEIE